MTTKTASSIAIVIGNGIGFSVLIAWAALWAANVLGAGIVITNGKIFALAVIFWIIMFLFKSSVTVEK